MYFKRVKRAWGNRKVISEEQPASVDDMEQLNQILRSDILDFLNKFEMYDKDRIIKERYDRFRKF